MVNRGVALYQGKVFVAAYDGRLIALDAAIDRTNGKFISAKNFVDVNWATGYDAGGRPIARPEARAADKAYDSIPGPYGAHNRHPMSFNPQTGLVYLPAQHVPLNLMVRPRP
ncbi:hypothetical protein A9P79_19460 [Cupriavidus taiwanensis]|nr:hypothetical protein A9P79_19460 [Cupriavidus taiwanensis]